MQKGKVLSKFKGCILGALIGDVIGASVEAQCAVTIREKYPNLNDILKRDIVSDEYGDWELGYFTDDTQTMIAVAEWLIHDKIQGNSLLQRFSQHYESWRRYGVGMTKIIELLPHCKNWQKLSSSVFVEGSYGNNSAVRVPPVSLCFANNYEKLIQIAKLSAVTTHSHRLAVQGTVLQAVAIMFALNIESDFDFLRIVRPLLVSLQRFQSYHQNTSEYQKSLDNISYGLNNGKSTSDMVTILGNDITLHQSLPTALYSFFKNYNSFEKTIEDVIYIGGDTDSIAAMAGALSGALLGVEAIPSSWLSILKEKKYNVNYFEKLAVSLYEMSTKKIP